ncbi:MAG: malonyl-CoA synthase [Rhodovibrionaceae bacterium]
MTDGGANLYALFKSRFPEDRTACLLRLSEGRRLAYGEMEEAVGRLSALFAKLGLEPGDRVALQVEKSPENLYLYLAIVKTGAVLLPLNTAYTDEEVGYFLSDAEPKLLVCQPERAEGLAEVARRAGVGPVLTLDGDGGGSLMAEAEGLEPDHAIAERKAGDLAAICYTSGTTGRSKGAMLSHGNLASNALTLHKLWGFEAGDVLLHALPIFHVHGLFVAINTCLLNGGSMIWLPRFDAEQVIRLLPEATVMMGVPTFYVRLLKEAGFTRELTRHMRLFVSGSAPLLEETFAAFEERTGQRILERYGMTETGMITSNPYAGERRAGTVGFPLPDLSVRICGAEGRALPPGEVGVLEVKGPNVFNGYWRQPEKTAEEFRDDGYFVTGDLAVQDRDGVISIVGRSKDLVISGGFNVYPKEIELVIDALPGIGESAVIGLPHPDFGEAVTAVATRSGETDEAAVIAACKAQLANFKVPKRVFFVDALPRNAMGKVQKNLLRETYGATFASG